MPEILNITAVEESLKADVLLQRFGALPLGGQLVLNHDRDPKPLYFQLLEHNGRNFSWKPLESGPKVWTVKIGKRPVDLQESIGQIVINTPRKAAVFKELGIDFSCSGALTLTEACEIQRLDVDRVRIMLDGELPQTAYPAMDFLHWDTGFFCKYMINLHHGYVRANLPFLLEMGEKIAPSYGATYTELLEVNTLVRQVAEGLTANMEQEEALLFPYLSDLAYALKSGTKLSAPATGSITAMVHAMEADHERIYDAFVKIRQLTKGYQPPDYVTHGFRILYKMLKEFENDLQMHFHLENNILFPAAIQNENKLRYRQLQTAPIINLNTNSQRL